MGQHQRGVANKRTEDKQRACHGYKPVMPDAAYWSQTTAGSPYALWRRDCKSEGVGVGAGRAAAVGLGAAPTPVVAGAGGGARPPRPGLGAGPGPGPGPGPAPAAKPRGCGCEGGRGNRTAPTAGPGRGGPGPTQRGGGLGTCTDVHRGPWNALGGATSLQQDQKERKKLSKTTRGFKTWRLASDEPEGRHPFSSWRRSWGAASACYRPLEGHRSVCC